MVPIFLSYFTILHKKYVASRFLLIFMLLGSILLVLPYNPKGDAMVRLGLHGPYFFSGWFFRDLRVRPWRVLRIIVTVEFVHLS